MKIPRTIPLALLISLPIFGSIFLPKHWGQLADLTLFTKGMLAYALMVLLSIGAMVCFGEGGGMTSGSRKSRAHGGGWFSTQRCWEP
jgi:hypothetical protein